MVIITNIAILNEKNCDAVLRIKCMESTDRVSLDPGSPAFLLLCWGGCAGYRLSDGRSEATEQSAEETPRPVAALCFWNFGWSIKPSMNIQLNN